MPADATAPEVRHNAAQQRFEARVEGELALADYRLSGQVMELTHTEVPRSLEGRGIAAALVRAALAHARAQGLRVRPLCSYAAAYVQRHPDTQDLLVP